MAIIGSKTILFVDAVADLPMEPEAGYLIAYVQADNKLRRWNVAGSTWVRAAITGTTKGDIPVHDGTDNQALKIGSDGKFLKADSTQTLGVTWATVTAGSGAYEIFLDFGTREVGFT